MSAFSLCCSDIEAVSRRLIVSFWLTRVVTRHFQNANFLQFLFIFPLVIQSLPLSVDHKDLS